MVRRLLAERFHLALHEEQKPIVHLDLEVAKGGGQLPLSPVAPSKPRYIFGQGAVELHPSVGLKLTGSKSPIRVVVVDRVDRTPVEN